MPLFEDRFLLARKKQSKILPPDHYDINKLPESILLLENGHCLYDMLYQHVIKKSGQCESLFGK